MRKRAISEMGEIAIVLSKRQAVQAGPSVDDRTLDDIAAALSRRGFMIDSANSFRVICRPTARASSQFRYNLDSRYTGTNNKPCAYHLNLDDENGSARLCLVDFSRRRPDGMWNEGIRYGIHADTPEHATALHNIVKSLYSAVVRKGGNLELGLGTDEGDMLRIAGPKRKTRYRR